MTFPRVPRRPIPIALGTAITPDRFQHLEVLGNSRIGAWHLKVRTKPSNATNFLSPKT